MHRPDPGDFDERVAVMTRPIRTLLFSTLYPSASRPVHGLFVESRLRELLRTGEVQSKVVAPVPWFFSGHSRFGDRAAMARTPTRENRHGIDVVHPRYLVIPKVGMSVAPALLALAALRPVRALIREGFDFDLIDSHYYYPDGVAAALLARHFGKPLVITARGSDINLVAQYALPRRWIQWAGERAAASIGVSAALVGSLRRLGLEASRLHALINGVDLTRFQPQPVAAARQRLGLPSGPILLMVGHLVELKGHRLAIDALALLRRTHPGAQLVIVGDGPERQRLERWAVECGLVSAMRFVGAVPNSDLADWYSAADVLVLASSREGSPNVVLEALACGTPVAATRVGGVPEIVDDPAVGSLVDERTAQALADAICRTLAAKTDRARIRAHAERFGWQQTTQRQLELFRSMLQASGRAHCA